ncbi:MAG: hypothetical protein DMG81_07650 [Acidobacteria bacterium]|nr:MAG: hypothetical protein DMG81_07650 [Acidobacteriota bacterium]
MAAQKLILIVDDTPTNIGVISGALRDSYKTKIATNGPKALALACAEEKPDLILLDVMMPEMDGYEVCMRLKADPSTREIPVIFLTGQTSAEDETRGFEVGAVDYVHKPFSPAVVKARVRSRDGSADTTFHSSAYSAASSWTRDCRTFSSHDCRRW